MSGVVEKFAEFCIRQRVRVVVVMTLATLALSYFALRVEVRTVFGDLLPTSHGYVQTHNRFKETFGGSNMVSIMVEVAEGEIFRLPVLEKVQTITRDLQQVEGVNQFQIISLASKKLREVRSSTDSIVTRPLMWPGLPKDEAELAQLREAVLNNPLVYGAYVSFDLKSTLITVDFIDRLINYEAIFDQVMTIVDRARGEGVRLRVVGEPILYGWVNYYLPESLYIVLLAVSVLITLLFVINRTWRGMLLPLLAGLISASWALGIAKLFNFHFDPLVIVVAMLITARAISHSVQIITRFDDEISKGAATPAIAAKVTMTELFRPGMLGIATDAGCVIVVALSPIPLLQKLAILAAVWVLTVAASAIVLTPVLLSWIRRPQGRPHTLDITPLLHRFLDLCALTAVSRARYGVVIGAAVVFVVSGMYAFNLNVGDANPGSPILWPDSSYNRDAAEINRQFQGSDRMFVVVGSERLDTLKKPVVLENMRAFQRFMETQPEIGGTVSMADIIPSINRILREDNPRYQELGRTQAENGELMYMFVSGADPGDLDRFADARFENGAVTLFFRDHRGETIRTAISRIKEFINKYPLAEAQYQLAGGLIGVLAAVNEVILSGQIQSIALALLVLVLMCTLVYRSTVAGMFFMVPVVLSNTVTFSYMAAAGIGMNLNTVPVAALGIGLGVDYALYIVDRIKEELNKDDDVSKAISVSLHSAGRGVLITASTLIASVILWWFSSLRFQAEMGMLMALWLFVSAISALLIMPAIVYIFRPNFIFRRSSEGRDQSVESYGASANYVVH